MALYGPTFVLILELFLLAFFTKDAYGRKDKNYWRDIGRSELLAAFEYTWNTNTAKNVIIFIGDGMSPETITASRVNSADEEGYLAWERFPHIGLLKTYDSSKLIPDSASTATALFCGVRTNYKVAGVDSNVRRYDCEAALKEENHVPSIFTWAQARDKATGFVTTSRITDATTSALYAHTADMDWQCEQYMPKSAEKCKDIARQLVEDQPGKNIKVIMGGGRQMLQSHATARTGDPIDRSTCYSKDGRNLVKDWAAEKARRNSSHTVVQNNEELSRVDPGKTDFLLGVFANGYMSMDSERITDPKGQPSLENMTITAIKILQKSQNGFFLVVEAGLIDVANTRGHVVQALQETQRFSEAINATLKLIHTNETLVIVTSNHGPSMSIPIVDDRRADVRDIGKDSICENIPHTTLGYTTEALRSLASGTNDATTPVIKNSSEEDSTAFTLGKDASADAEQVPMNALDVAVYAIGPYAHLFHTTSEQNFVAHVVAYSAEVGEYYIQSHGTSPTACSLILLVPVLPAVLYW